MPKRILLPFLVALFAFFMTSARAADRERLQAFLEVTGFDVALDSIALSAADAPAMLGMDASAFGADWSRMSEEVFDTTKMRETALDILSQTLSDDLLTHAAGFYASPLGQRLVEVENAAHMDQDDDARESIGGAVVEAGGERVANLRRMNDAIDSAGTAVKGVHEIQIRFLMAASNAGVLEREIDEAALRALLKQSEDQLRQTLKESGLVSAAYTYRDLSDADLEAYAEALEHPDMMQVYVLMNAVQYEIMANRFETLAGRMAGLTPGQEL
ncbi:DUF2059 domain-containing protein [uncultured Roseovarius sp.]|uniref:DUF2059 domain-containing protein n=1 Tax=uncultured Roseovarius sp. TaxID=293344 RepID=UPI00261CC596|nr:DUF2059 domain-containing protein [uncultured Roseovarius sp.]